MKHKLSCVTLMLAFCFLLSLTVSHEAAAQSGGVSWQQSQAPSVTLGVRDKYGALGDYTARFIITDGGGHKTQRSVAVHADAFGFMVYPNDVTNYPPNWMYSGTYSWVCVVRGQVAARGKFSLSYTSHGQQLRTIDPF